MVIILIMPSTDNILTDEKKLLRAYHLLASTIDNHRIIVGAVTRDWVKSEIEKNVPINDIPSQTWNTVVGRDILKTELYPDESIDLQEINITDSDLKRIASRITINTNRLSKLEPLINAAVLSGAILCGARMFGDNIKSCSIDNDLIIATIIHYTAGKEDRFSALLPSEYKKVDDSYIREYFGENVLQHLKELLRYLELFNDAYENGTVSSLEIPGDYANAIAAIMVSTLRLTARAAGDAIFSTLDEEKKMELRERGIEPDGDFPERRYLEHDFLKAKAALKLKGVDYKTIREPLTSTLMTAVGDALTDTDKRKRLCGRRGKALHDVHVNLPIMEYYNATEAPNSLGTLHVAALESMRHLDRGRRKGNATMLAHALRVAGIVAEVMGTSFSPVMATVAILHDIVEDGQQFVIGYDQSAEKVKLRFGAPVAAMVCEVTDSKSRTDGSRKALATYLHPALVFPEKQYDVSRFVEMHTKPTDSDIPYTLPGIITKLIDTLVTQEEGIRDPDIMIDWWRHSGIRIFWHQNTKGNITRNLIERLALEVKLSQVDVNYYRRNDAVPQELLGHIRNLLNPVLDTDDIYTVQNLAILANEYRLNEKERQQLISSFFNPQINSDQFETNIVESLLADARLESAIASGHVPSKAYVALYRKVKEPPEPRDSSTFLGYRKSALRRREIRAELGLDTAFHARILRKKLDDAIHLYDSQNIT
ncbi:MAG: hypothetical protein CSYNP_00239 [Syntrophus sp. SKADARSKE-3]|nr:hypothetical protein [Syntrophus sp. SKADARSKE-3]